MINQPGQDISTPLEQGIKQTGNGGRTNNGNDTGLVSKQRDERGDADYNLELSQKRVEFVRDQLIQAGVSASNIDVTAHGESVAQDRTEDSFALERRVSVTLFIDGNQSVASTSD